MRMNKLVVFFMFITLTASSQDIKTTEITVIEDFKPSIPEPSRLNINAVFADTTEKDKTQTYTIINTQLNSAYQITPLKAAVIKGDKIPRLYGTKVSLATGYRIKSKAQILYNTKRSKTLSYGLVYNHFRDNKKINGNIANSNEDLIYLYGKMIGKNNILTTHVDYERRKIFSYGHKVSIPENTLPSQFTYTRLLFSIISKESAVHRLKHSSIFFVSDLNQMSENRIHFSSNITKNIQGYPFSLDIEFDNYSNYKSEQEVLNLEAKDVQLFALSPGISQKRFGIDFECSLGIDYASDGGVDLFPSIITTKEFVKNILLVSAGIQDDKFRNTYKRLSDLNSFIHTKGTNQTIIANDTLLDLRTTEAKEGFFEITNVLAQDEIWKTRVTYGFVENLPYFDNNHQSSYNRFLVVYVDAWQLHLYSSYDKRINDILDLNLQADYYNWGNIEIAHKPNLFLNASLALNLRDKIRLNPRIQYIGSQKAFILKEEVLDSRIHLDLDFKYNYSNNLSIYMLFNNLTNSQKEIWRGYQEIGFNGVFGVNYIF